LVLLDAVNQQNLLVKLTAAYWAAIPEALKAFLVEAMQTVRTILHRICQRNSISANRAL